jgi:hypothetical protein
VTVLNATLAERLSAHPRFEWHSGMWVIGKPYDLNDRNEVIEYHGPIEISEDGPGVLTQRSLKGHKHDLRYFTEEPTLDLTHPSSVGWLLEMLPQCWSAGCRPDGTWFICERRTSGWKEEGATLGEAVARALLALWGDG